MLLFFRPKKWFEAFSKVAERQSNLIFLPLFGCNVTSVQFGMKRIRDSTPERCSHKPEESTVLFCSAPLPPYSCWLTKWQQGRIYPSLQMTHCGFLGSKAWPKWSKLRTVTLSSRPVCKVVNDCINSSALSHCHYKQLRTWIIPPWRL